MPALTSTLNSWPLWLALVAAAWLLWSWCAARLLDNARRDVIYGLSLLGVRVYSKWFHRLRVFGREHVPGLLSAADRESHPVRGPLIIVANHTAGIDPILIHAELRADIRWMMARDMMLESLAPVWEWLGVISVDRNRKDLAGAREALKLLKGNGIIGIFPEGGLERPAGQVRPFHPGVGLLIAKTEAPVLPVLIQGTPQVDPAWRSLWKPSRSRITFMPVQHYCRTMRSADIVADLEGKFRDWMAASSPPRP